MKQNLGHLIVPCSLIISVPIVFDKGQLKGTVRHFREMSTPTSTAEAVIPNLDSVYSGVPNRLAKEAVAAKSRLDSQRTVQESSVRKAVSLPLGVAKEQFVQAINELKTSLGSENVEINDKPLVDGWYMQHP